MTRRLRWTAAFIAAIWACTGAWGQQTIARGDWTATLGTMGPGDILYKGEVIARKGSLGGYLPAWKGTRFGMGGSELTTTETRAAWHKMVEGNQEATVTLELTENGFAWTLDTKVYAAGPTEFGLQIVPEAVRTEPDRCMVWINDILDELDLVDEVPFTRVGGLQEMRFEQPERTVTVRCEGFEIQDRRKGNGGLYVVRVIGSSGEKAVEETRRIEVQIDEAAPEKIAGRRAFVGQRLQTTEPMLVTNGGFETEGAVANWSENPNAALDETVARTGKQSARITLRGGEADENPYLTKMIPVIEGRLYDVSVWVKTQGVETALVRKMSSTGATIIVEFADKERKWFAAGSYATGVYGDRDWFHVQTNAARAPQGAGYAIIFLSLRAHGTAWFDDVQMRQVTQGVVRLSPTPGELVRDNTPTFTWAGRMKSPAMLELSQSEQFPEGETVRAENLQDATGTIRRPLAPGKWYWRLQIPDMHYTTDAWDFVQTASLEEDCTEPEIAGEHKFLERPDETVRLTYSDNVGVEKVTLSVNGEDVTGDATIGKTVATYAPENGWTEGLHKVLLRAEDAAGNAAERRVFFTYAKPTPKIVWQETGGVEIDGKRRFLFGMYGARVEDMPRIAAGGFDFVHNYSWDGTGSNETAIEYLDEAQKHGMQAFIGFNRKRLMAGDEEFVAERIGALMTHPGLFAWYLFDEPDLTFQYVSPTWLTRFYKLIKKLDPYHPVVVTCAMDDSVAKYRDSFDVHWTQVYGAPSFVARRIPKQRAALKPNWPLMAICHSYDRALSGLRAGNKPYDIADFQPDARLLRANAFMALAKNSSCIAWWWWGQGSTQAVTVADAPLPWAGLQQTVADIKTLEPLLTADGQIQTWIEAPEEGIEVHFWQKQIGQRTLIIAVNRDDQAIDVTLQPKNLPADCTLTRLFEEGTVDLNDGQATDRFDGLAVHVYEHEG